MMAINQTRTFLAALGLSAAALLAIMLAGAFASPQRALAIEADPKPELTVVSSPAVLVLGDTLVLTLTISNPLKLALSDLTITQTLAPQLDLLSISADNATIDCKNAWPCTVLELLGESSLTLTATYWVAAPNLVGKEITHTSTLSLTALSEPLERKGTTAAVSGPDLAAGANFTSVAPIFIGDTLVITMTASNPGSEPLTAVTLDQALTEPLPLTSLSADAAAFACTKWPCTALTLAPGATTITATYWLAAPNLVGKEITHTSSLSMSALSAPITRTLSTQAVQKQRVFLPLVRRAPVDIYAQWVKLSPPTGGAAVNYLYVSQADDQCSGPNPEQYLPSKILAATNQGIYQLKPAEAINTFGSWEQLPGTANISASHIISTTFGYFAGSFNQGAVLRSTDDGVTWAAENLLNNQRTYWLATSGNRVFAASNRGLYIRESSGGWAAEPQITGAVFGVAAAGNNVYAIQIGASKDTLWRSNTGGAAGSWMAIGQLPGAANFMQTLSLSDSATSELLIGVVGNGIYRFDGVELKPFSTAPNLTVYGLWRDAQARIYAAFREPGGLQRFAPGGGQGEALHAFSGTAPNANERLFTVNGNPGGQCGIIIAGSREGNVWLRRIP